MACNARKYHSINNKLLHQQQRMALYGEANPNEETIRASISKRIEVNYPLEKQCRGLKPLPTEEESIIEYGDQLVEWSENPENMELARFPLSLRHNPYKFYRLSEKNEYFRDCLETAKLNIAIRLIEGWRTGRIKESFVKAFLPMFDETYKQYLFEVISLRSHLQAQAQQQGSVINVIMDKIENSPLVPVLKADNE